MYPQEEEPLSWDYDDENPPSNDDMFAGSAYNTNQSPSQQQQQGGNDDDTRELPSEEIQGAELTQDMVQRAKASHNDEKEEASQGGSKFRELMARARQSASAVLPELGMQPPPPQSYHHQQQQQPMFDQIPDNFMEFSIEEQARLFREIMEQRQRARYNAPPAAMNQNPYQQQQAYQQQPYPPQQPYQQQPYPPQQRYPPQQNYREYGTGFDGRRIGRNKDADAIANESDVYFARLKRDSTSRNYARYAGDNTKANEVFFDPAIPEIKGPEENPYRKEQKERERELIETAPEEMLIFQEYGQDETEQQQMAPRAPSYRDRVAKFQAQRQERQEQTHQQWAQQQQQQQSQTTQTPPSSSYQTKPSATPSWQQQSSQLPHPSAPSPPSQTLPPQQTETQQEGPPKWKQSWSPRQSQQSSGDDSSNNSSQGDGNPPPFDLY